MSPSKKQERVAVAALGGDADNLDKIRDILFGGQMRDYEMRFARLEEYFLKEAADIRETNRRRFEQLEKYMDAEFSRLRAQLPAEVATPAGTGVEPLPRPQESERPSISGARDKRDESSQEIHARCAELGAIIETRVRELRTGTVDRAALAALFTEVALRLSDELRSPGSET